jgi:hypothetical protein
MASFPLLSHLIPLFFLGIQSACWYLLFSLLLLWITSIRITHLLFYSSPVHFTLLQYILLFSSTYYSSPPHYFLTRLHILLPTIIDDFRHAEKLCYPYWSFLTSLLPLPLSVLSSSSGDFFRTFKDAVSSGSFLVSSRTTKMFVSRLVYRLEKSGSLSHSF